MQTNPAQSLRQLLLIGIPLTVSLSAKAQHGGANTTAKNSPSVKDTLTDVGAYRLHFRVVTGRPPTIVLESGGGADASQWSTLQPQLARETGLAVVSYDRAGFGESDLPLSPYNAIEETQGLRAGLERLGFAKEVILVGHSYGGLLNQLYANKYRDSVKGIVLIDPNTVAFVDAIGGPEKLMDIPFDTTPPLTKIQKAGIRQIKAFAETVEMVRSAPIPKDIPVLLITAGKPWWPTRKESDAYRAGHESIVGEAANRSLVVAEGSGHNIPGERPDVVTAAIERLISNIRHKEAK